MHNTYQYFVRQRRPVWVTISILVVFIQTTSGCRTLNSGRQKRELAAARQFSLRGADALQQQNYSDAEALFSEALRRSPDDERAQWGMAEVLWEKGHHKVAAQHMEAAAEIGGEHPEMLVRLGEMHLQTGDLDAAMENATRALQGNRQHPDAWALHGEVLTRQGQHEEAVQSYHRALIARPNNPSVQIALADVYYKLERPQRALATLELIADGHPEGLVSPKAWMLKGQSLAALGESWEAQKCLRQAANFADADDASLLRQLAEAQFAAGDLAEARICLGRSLRHDPQNPQALKLQSALDQRFTDYSDQEHLRVLSVGFGGKVEGGNPEK
jgi:tetratricopeptide (TPR) repeat protein